MLEANRQGVRAGLCGRDERETDAARPEAPLNRESLALPFLLTIDAELSTANVIGPDHAGLLRVLDDLPVELGSDQGTARRPERSRVPRVSESGVLAGVARDTRGGAHVTPDLLRRGTHDRQLRRYLLLPGRPHPAQCP